MKKNYLKIALFGLGLVEVVNLSAQNILYKDSHKEVEYNYAIIDSGTIEGLTETEKIKYELRYMEKTISKKILEDYSTEMMVIYDSNGYAKDWLALPKRILFNNTGKHLYSMNNELLKTIDYSDEQLLERINDKIDIENQGYHPGLVNFPEGNQGLYSAFNSAGIQYEDLGNGKYTMITEGTKTTYDKQKLLITTEWVNDLGEKCRDYDGYKQMENGKGYIKIISKQETSVRTWKGLCLTAMKVIYYDDFQLEDPAGLMNKAIQLDEPTQMVTIYPNPNDGVFTAEFILKADNVIQQIQLVNGITGAITEIAVTNLTNGVMQINASAIPSGIYTLKALTNNTTLIRQFFKQ